MEQISHDTVTGTRPLEFYAVVFTVRGGDLDAEAAVVGKQLTKTRMQSLLQMGNERTAKDESSRL